ncbi:MAG: ASCH domain-containing protein [Candidatus Coproplasma sp.]
MNLQQRPFDSIKSGIKTVEMRLYDKKRQGINAGDDLEFTSPKGDKLTVRVKAVRRFNNFEELYANYSPRELGYFDGEICSPADMLAYYGEEQIKEYGVAAIEIGL